MSRIWSHYACITADQQSKHGISRALIPRGPDGLKLPPLWSLGYQQSRYSYYPEARVREIARLFREKKIPADVIYLDIDYQDGNRAFTIDRKLFPNFEGMIRDRSAQGFKVVAITDPHLKKEPGLCAIETNASLPRSYPKFEMKITGPAVLGD